MKVLLIVIDAATPRVLCPAVRTGQLHVMQQLAERGTMHEQSVTIFPSITPAATTSIVTGCYPAEHGIAGASWYDEERQEVAYYGDDFWVILREGFGEFIRDFLLRLNGDRLTAPTLFEMIERTGRRAACLNYLVYRGLSAHKVEIPGVLAALPGVPLTATVEGPSILSLGDFVGPRTPRGRPLAQESGLLHRFGMDDASTGAMLKDLMAEKSLPDFTVGYFADNDYRSHVVGPYAALPVVERVDRMLGEAFEAAGGLDAVLRDTYVVITSDHGHCEVLADEERAVIRLDALLSNFRLAKLGRPWSRRDEVMICPNMRAAQIYLQHPSHDLVELVASEALTDRRIDLAVWTIEGRRRTRRTYVAASQRGRLEFARGRADGSGWADGEDGSGCVWQWRGDPTALDFALAEGRLAFTDYPNAFERVASVLDLDKSGELWLTAKPGSEFEVPGSAAHVAGASHGALHALDSYCPVIIAGPSQISLPTHMRSVDLAPLCMSLLGLDMRYAIGDPRGI